MDVTFFVVRHGQTLFNVMGKVQGWCDTPLTEEGVRAARSLGRGLAGVDFAAAYSSDSGRAVQTLHEVLDSRAAERARARFDERAQGKGSPASVEAVQSAVYVPAGPNSRSACAEDDDFSIPAAQDARLREWCYGDLEGEPGEQLHRVFAQGFGRKLSFAELNSRLPEVADVIAAADRSGRAERFADIEIRLKRFFEDAGRAALAAGGGNVLVVTHSFVVRTLVYLLEPSRVNDPLKILNASVTRLAFDGECFSLGDVGSMEYVR